MDVEKLRPWKDGNARALHDRCRLSYAVETTYGVYPHAMDSQDFLEKIWLEVKRPPAMRLELLRPWRLGCCSRQEKIWMDDFWVYVAAGQVYWCDKDIEYKMLPSVSSADRVRGSVARLVDAVRDLKGFVVRNNAGKDMHTQWEKRVEEEFKSVESLVGLIERETQR